MRYQLWMTEKINGEMREESKRTGKVNTYITFISDAQDLSIKQMAYKPGRPNTYYIGPNPEIKQNIDNK